MPRTESALQLVCAAARSAGLGQRTDPELLAGFLDGDATAFEALVRRHGPMVLRTCRTATRCEADAEDAFQTTFIVLNQKARSVRDKRSLAGWLFRVARRSAGNARRAADRRDRRQATIERPTTPTSDDLSWREACTVLHAEIDRLPETYRLPLVLCYLQGLSRDEAARRLGWSLNEVRGRLERGRVRLRQCLVKRGITLSAGLLSAATASGDSLPPSLLEVVRRAVRAPVAASGRGSILLGTKGLAVAGALAAAVLVAVAGGSRDPQDRPPDAPPRTSAPAVAIQPADTVSRAAVVVRVLGPDGKPFSGAKLFVFGPEPAGAYVKTPALYRSALSAPEPPSVSEAFPPTDGDGRGTVRVPTVSTVSSERADSPFQKTIVAIADGLGPDWWFANAVGPPKEFTIQLVKDVPIRGRLIDLEGKPAAGVEVHVVFTEDRPLELADLVELPKANPRVDTIATKILFGPPPGAPAKVKTDKDGRFTLTGLGRDRLVLLRVSGPGLADETIPILTNPDVDVKECRYGRPMKPDFVYSLLPTRPLRGTVRDAHSGKAIAGAMLREADGRAVTTDRDGKYELPVSLRGSEHAILVDPPEGTAYFPSRVVTPGAAGAGPLTLDVKLQPGVPIRGRVIDGRTKKPIAGGVVTYVPLAPNAAVRVLISATHSEGEGDLGPLVARQARLAADGTFRLTALPGPGALLVEADPLHYPAARVDPMTVFPRAGQLDAETSAELIVFQTRGGGRDTIRQEQFRAVVLMEMDSAKPPNEFLIPLTPADPIRGRLLDPDGKPLVGVTVRGLMGNGQFSRPLATADFEASPLHPDRPRYFYFRHEGRKLVGTAVVSKIGTGPIDATLRPWASVTGRVLEPDGTPAELTVDVFAADAGPGASFRRLAGGTKRDGTFRINGLIPGVRYEVTYHNRHDNSGRKGVVASVELKEAETKDVGEIRMPTK
jgi:RNA polymerase sigma factor (sigma-70 family)